MALHVSERQLSLFRGKRQRGVERRFAPTEFQLHCMVADTIRRWLMPGWIYTHIASGEKRDPVTAARLKRMGVCAGWPDLLFLGPAGEVCAVELKTKGGRLPESQIAVKRHLEAAGHGYLVSSDYREVIETLKGWGVVRAGISVQ